MGDWERTGCVYNLVASARSSDQTAVQNYKSFTVRSFKFLGLEKIRSYKNLDEIHYINFQPKSRRNKHDLTIKLITWMDGKSRDKSIKPN